VSALGLGGHEYARFLNPYHFPETRKPEERVPQDVLDATQPPRNRLIARAIDAGVNYFDTGVIEECQSLGSALRTLGRRDAVHIAAETMGPVRRLQAVPKARWREALLDGVDERLKLLQTDRIDVFNVHELADGYSRDRFEYVMEVLNEVRADGKIGAIGVADHQPRFVAEVIRRYDCFDAVMVPYNYQLQDARHVLFPLCRALAIGVVVMKPFCWPYYGIAFPHFAPANRATRGCTPIQVSLQWILASPEVSTIVPGTNTLDELEENLAALDHDYAGDERVLRACLDRALSPEGKETLRALVTHGEIARTRAYIRGYAQRALEGWQEH
jgi:aryl-alcohol dehydrogenase-like predicted oxidoreductase